MTMQILWFAGIIFQIRKWQTPRKSNFWLSFYSCLGDLFFLKKTNENIDGFKCLRLLISLLSLRTCESLLWICYGSVKVCYGSCYYNRSIFKLFGIKMKQFQMLNLAMYKQFKIMNLSILEKLYCFSSLKKYIWWCNRLMNIRN